MQGRACAIVYRQLKGNGSIVTRVDSVANTDGWAKAGVMIREDFQTGSANALVAVTPANGISFQWRPTRDAASSNVAVAGLAAQYWVKVTRTGAAITAQYSANGVAWTDLVATPSVTIPMASDVYIGPRCLRPHDPGVMAQGTGTTPYGATARLGAAGQQSLLPQACGVA